MKSGSAVLRGTMRLVRRLSRCDGLSAMTEVLLPGLAQEVGLESTALLVFDAERRVLVTIASHGFPRAGIGSELTLGEGPIGAAAAHRTAVRIGNFHSEVRYGRAVRAELARSGQVPQPSILPPGLLDTQSILVVPLEHRDLLVGVLAAESPLPGAFGEGEEAALTVIGAVIAPALLEFEAADEPGPPSPETTSRTSGGEPVLWVYHPADDSVFVGHEYLIRGVPGRILVRLLRAWLEQGRVEFNNRELRADASLQLPAWRDNLEARLILLRRRLLEQPCGVRLEPRGRGRFALVVDTPLRLVEGPARA